jgi:hypothetical protein
VGFPASRCQKHSNFAIGVYISKRPIVLQKRVNNLVDWIVLCTLTRTIGRLSPLRRKELLGRGGIAVGLETYVKGNVRSKDSGVKLSIFSQSPSFRGDARE